MEEALKISEANLRQAQKLESIGLLAGGIAHDFNNILATITLHTEFLIHELDASIPPEELTKRVKKCLEEIRKSSERATGLTRKLLSFSRRQMLQPKVHNLNILVTDMREMLQRMVEENIEFKIDLSPEIKNIYVDHGHIEQILLNLVINSRDAMPQGGLLKIETKNVLVDEKTAQGCNIKSGDYVLLTVSDSGIGMSDEIQKNIFEPFFTTKPVGKGTGLGLSTVYGIMQQSKGCILVESKIGQGASFKLYFPATEENVQESKTFAKEAMSLTGTETILVVEDENGLKNLIAEVLIKNGYKILKASNGTEALEIIKSGLPIDLVITDVVMPQMGGAELARHTNSINNKIRFLFQSGYLNETLAENGIETEKINFIHKPFKPDDLLIKIRNIFST